MDRTFDWIPRFDERSRNYPIRTVVGTPIRKPRMWRQGRVLDQGREGACVGFGWTAELLAKPYQPHPQPSEVVGNAYARQVYKEAQKIDEWPGENYEGTSVLAGAKVIQSRGLINEYRWCFGVDDVIDAVIAEGPVVLGVPWYEKMYSTNPSGLVGIGGRKVGGHCITITGYNPRLGIDGAKREVFRWRNSWGTGYGVNGSGYIEVSNLKHLLDEGGEACVPMTRSQIVL